MYGWKVFGVLALSLTLTGGAPFEAWATKGKKSTAAKQVRQTSKALANRAPASVKRAPASKKTKKRRAKVNYRFPLSSLVDAKSQVIFTIARDMHLQDGEEGFCFMNGDQVSCEHILSFDSPACRLSLTRIDLAVIPAGFGARLGFVDPNSRVDNLQINTRGSEWLGGIACTQGDIIQTLGDLKAVFGAYLKFEKGTALESITP